MSKETHTFQVTLTFDLSYSNSPEYRLINAYLDEKGFSSLKSMHQHMPSNVYTGVVDTEIEVNGDSLTFDELKVGADKVVRNTFESIKRNADSSGLIMTLFVQASPYLVTSNRKSRG